MRLGATDFGGKNMIEQTENRDEFVGVNFKRLVDAVLNKSWLVMLVSVVCAALIFAYTFFLVTPMYESSVMFYVNNNAISVGSTSLSLSSSDITASRGLVETYMVILNTRETLSHVTDYAGTEHSYRELSGMISAEAVEETEVFRVTVTSPSPEEAELLANSIAYILPKRISNIVEGTSAKVVDAAVIPSAPSSPSYSKNTMIGFLLGLFVSVLIIVLRELFDISIRNEEDISQCCKHPILATVPDMASSGKGGYYYSSYEKASSAKKKPEAGKKTEQETLIGGNISFAAAEAYKLLRTKLQFSFADDNGCRVLGLTSALSGEGKSLTSVNLAYSLSQLDKNVLLIDCDMRRPTIAKKLGIKTKPGLSSFLTGQIGPEELIQYCGVPKDEMAFHVIAAGECPPNPVELLSSERMSVALDSLRRIYDYVILDLPPVGEVSDALSVAKMTDGTLLVVRQNLCNRPVLKDTVRQFDFIEAKMLGLVFNCADEHSGVYGRKYYYGKKYYKTYGKYNKTQDV